MSAPATARRDVLFPDHYAWYVLVCAMDLILTNTLINYFGAIEVNGLAARAIHAAGFPGLIALKLVTMIVVVLICEHVGRSRHDLARRLASWAVALSAIPCAIALLQLAVFRG